MGSKKQIKKQRNTKKSKQALNTTTKKQQNTHKETHKKETN